MINVKINALRRISHNLDFKTRKTVANSIVNSRFVYIVQLYGSAPDYLLKMLQIQQNKAARIVTRQHFLTETTELLKQTGWLSIRQLFVYHSLLLTFKVMNTGSPCYIQQKISHSFPYQTRQATGGCISVTETPKSDCRRRSFIHSSIRYWNLLPGALRSKENIQEFKTELRKWTVTTIPI